MYGIEKEIEGLKTQINTLIEKKNFLMNDLSIAYETEAKFSLKKKIEKIEDEINAHRIELAQKEQQTKIVELPQIPLPLQPIHEAAKGEQQDLQNKELIVFPENEKKQMQLFGQRLFQEKVGLLIGNPASGKSILVQEMGKTWQEQGKKVYYYSYKRGHGKKIGDLLLPLCQQPLVFIIDDIHLDTEDAAYLFNHLPTQRVAAFLFVSRRLERQEQNLEDNDEANIYALENQWDTEVEIEAKMQTIILHYQARLREKNPSAFAIQDIKKVVQSLKSDLLAISYYIDAWTETQSLEEVSRENMLKKLYNRYWKHKGERLDAKTTQVLCFYAALYSFEIEGMPEPYEDTLAYLQKLGILYCGETSVQFYHSNFAIMLLQSYAQAKNKDFETFVTETLAKYIGENKPQNLHTIFLKILANKSSHTNNTKVYAALVQNPALKELIQTYYAKVADKREVWFLVGTVASYAITVFLEYFSILISNTPETWQADNVLPNYLYILRELKKQTQLEQGFWKIWGSFLVLAMNLSHLTHGSHQLRSIHTPHSNRSERNVVVLVSPNAPIPVVDTIDYGLVILLIDLSV
ncbi:MAG: hypothetical protein ACKVTZ_17140, partial [Bacteroidia bacterium]